MPLLPRKNSLDYNPDATIAASKKLTAIALERMKNPLEDPDFATLSTLNAQRSLGDSVDRLEDLAGQFHSLVLRMGNLLLSGQGEQLVPEEIVGNGRKGRKKGGAKGDPYDPRYDDYSAMYPSSSSSSASTPRPRGRPPQPIPRDINPQELLRLLAEQMSERRRADDFSSSAGSTIDPREFNRRLQADRGRFRQFYDDDDRNSFATSSNATSSRGVPIYPYDDPMEVPIDDEDNSTLPTYRTYGYDYDPNAPLVPEAMRAGEGQGATFNSLIFPLIQITRRMNMLLNSKIKPAIPSLSGSQVKRMNDIYQMVRTSYNDVVRPQNRRDFRMGFEGKKDPFTGAVYRPNAYLQQRFGNNSLEQQLIQYNQFGDEMLGTWDIERKNLLLNLTVVINSWKQNTPTGQQTEFAEDITRSFQNTAKRLGKKADLVEALQQGLGDTDYAKKLRDDADALESVAQGAGRKPRGRPRKKDTMTMTMVGSGRNFYGEKINESRDIPTIWRSYQDCPTKYLL